MSEACARRLIAGTVKPDTSPWPRAEYRSWMLALWAPRAWLASQTIHRAAAVVASPPRRPRSRRGRGWRWSGTPSRHRRRGRRRQDGRPPRWSIAGRRSRSRRGASAGRLLGGRSPSWYGADDAPACRRTTGPRPRVPSTDVIDPGSEHRRRTPLLLATGHVGAIVLAGILVTGSLPISAPATPTNVPSNPATPGSSTTAPATSPASAPYDSGQLFLATETFPLNSDWRVEVGHSLYVIGREPGPSGDVYLVQRWGDLETGLRPDTIIGTSRLRSSTAHGALCATVPGDGRARGRRRHAPGVRAHRLFRGS